jgi:hypothetical protein
MTRVPSACHSTKPRLAIPGRDRHVRQPGIRVGGRICDDSQADDAQADARRHDSPEQGSHSWHEPASSHDSGDRRAHDRNGLHRTPTPTRCDRNNASAQCNTDHATARRDPRATSHGSGTANDTAASGPRNNYHRRTGTQNHHGPRRRPLLRNARTRDLSRDGPESFLPERPRLLRYPPRHTDHDHARQLSARRRWLFRKMKRGHAWGTNWGRTVTAEPGLVRTLNDPPRRRASVRDGYHRTR